MEKARQVHTTAVASSRIVETAAVPIREELEHMLSLISNVIVVKRIVQKGQAVT